MPQQKEAATQGMWTFLATEILFFGCMFMGYIMYRHAYPLAFAEASRHTIVLFGTVNTAILLTSSLTMALAVRASQLGQAKKIVLFLCLTLFLGVCFLGVKGLEYHEDLNEQLWPGRHFKAGLPPQAQIFWFLYWAMTGLHALHVTVGIVLISIITRMAYRRRFSEIYHTPVEIIGLYWHFVDIIWIFLYPLLYLVSRS
ncbi:MAG TPA: cytochrome c oxidase subunit 3 family protein [Verrucomicrobiae bacterium]|nr:cytochrome c oxidase subunit 3 family protein [Verrucomicrobiae bacterium]